MANVVLTPAAAEQLDGLSNPIHARLLKLLTRLQDWPQVSGAKALSGDLAGCYRLRTGDYRLQFQVSGEQVIVDKIAHRDGFYDD